MIRKSGFSLLELLVAIAILGLLATIVVPMIRRSRPQEVREKFINNLNKLTSFAWQNAIKTQKVYKVNFNFGKKEIFLSVESEKDKYGAMQYLPVKRAYIKTKMTIPAQLELKNFYVEKKDLAGEIGKSGSKSGDAWFFITDGVSQTVVINFFDNQDRIDRAKRPVSLVLNPFSAQFEVYDEFKKP
ncbi:type II secretion system protein [Candidatus Dependentiae bacterium]